MQEPITKNGFYQITNEDYHADPAASKSSLSDFSHTPKKFKINRQIIKKSSPVFDLGTAAHAAILEPEKYWDMIAVPPAKLLAKNGAMSTKAAKEWKAQKESEGKVVIKQDFQDKVEAMAENVLERPEHSEARALLTGGVAELSGFWEETEFGAPFFLKVRPDYLPGGNLVVDLKTDLDASPVAFGRKAYNLKYHWSAWLTCRGLEYLTGEKHDKYFFVVVEKEIPFDVAVYQVPDYMFEIARRELTPILERYSQCLETDEWPGYENKRLMLDFPGWALRALDDGALYD